MVAKAAKNTTANPGTRKRMAPDERRREILRVALDVCSSGQFASVTMRDVALASNVNIALIYYYFKSKEHLVASVIEQSMRQTLELYENQVAGVTDPHEALDKWFQVNSSFFAPLKKMVQIMVRYQNSSSVPSLIDQQIRKFYRSERQIIRRCVAKGIETGCFRRIDPVAAAAFISAHLDGILFVSLSRPWTDMRSFMHLQWRELWDYLQPNRDP